MKTLTKINHRHFGIILFLLITIACKTDKKQNVQTETQNKKTNIVEVITRSMDFQTADTLKSGWNTFAYKNLSGEVHFFIMDKLEKYRKWILDKLTEELDYDFLSELIYLSPEEFDEYVRDNFGAREDDLQYLWVEYIKIVNAMPYYGE